MTDLETLIARLEAATEGSRELDGEIYSAMSGKATGLNNADDYTTSIDAALTLVPEGYDWDVGRLNGRYIADVSRKVSEEGWLNQHARGPSSALALCIAALKAMKL